jgi:hypothetical protein
MPILVGFKRLEVVDNYLIESNTIMARRTNRQRHLNSAEAIGNYADAFKKWKWLIWPLTGTIAGNPLIQSVIEHIRKIVSA